MTVLAPRPTDNRADDRPAVDCRHLVIRYGAAVAVDGASFTVRPGEVMGLLGPNGAGKTSVIRALTTIIRPDDGTATVDGYSLDAPVALRRRIGVLPESSGYPGHQTLLTYLRYHGQLYGMSASVGQERGSLLLEQFGLSERCHDLVRTLSRGMRQRLGLCRSLINQPRVLFLDEPTLGLDPAGKEEILGRIRRVTDNDGMAVVLCSHLLDEVERVCDRVTIMHRGHVVAAGSVPDVVAAAGLSPALRLRVRSDDRQRAAAVLDAIPWVDAVRSEPFDSDAMEIHFSSRPDASTNRVLAVLLKNEISIAGVETAGVKLSDAFLALTSDGNQGISTDEISTEEISTEGMNTV